MFLVKNVKDSGDILSFMKAFFTTFHYNILESKTTESVTVS